MWENTQPPEGILPNLHTKLTFTQESLTISFYLSHISDVIYNFKPTYLGHYYWPGKLYPLKKKVGEKYNIWSSLFVCDMEKTPPRRFFKDLTRTHKLSDQQYL